MDILSLVLAKGYAKVLFDRLNNVGRFLSVWDAATGLPLSFPSTTPYTYKTGDYYVVGHTDVASDYPAYDNPSSYHIYDTSATYNIGDKVTSDGAYYICNTNGTTGDWDASKWDAHTLAVYNVGSKCTYSDAQYICNTAETTGEWDATKWDAHTLTNYKPDGTTYTGTASTTVETENISKLDMYYFDGTNWMVITSTTVLSAVVTSLAGSTGAIDIGNCLQMTSNSLNVKAIPYITTAPTENRANDGTLIDVVLSADPPGYYQGYRYNIFGS